MGIRRTDAPPARTDEERRRAREERERRRAGKPAPPPPPPAVEPDPPPPSPPPAVAEPDLPPVAEPAPRRSAEPDLLRDPPPAAESVPPAVGPVPPAVEPDPPPSSSRPAAEPDPPRAAPPDPPPESLRVDASPREIADSTPRDASPSGDEAQPPRDEAQPPRDEARSPRPDARRPHLSRPHVGAPHVHRPRLHTPHLHRPRLHRPHVRRRRSVRARLGAFGALAIAVALVGAGAFAVERAIRRRPVAPLATRRVVIPEGSTRFQIAAIARSDGLSGDYLKASASSARLQPSRYGAPSHERSLEGFLFPATYEMYAGASARQLLDKQLSAFSESFSAHDATRARALDVTPYQLLTVASIIEREASLPRERPLVAAVIYNRLHRNMPLGIDATLRYALHNDYTHPLTEAQLHSSSDYNTRTHTGLPPTPISNPGLASIEAAANPAHVSYLYYVARADGCPGQVFSSSYAQFERDATAYRDALRANHGSVPTCRRR